MSFFDVKYAIILTTAANYTPAGQVSILFSGTALSVPYETNLNAIMQRLQEDVQFKVSTPVLKTTIPAKRFRAPRLLSRFALLL